MQGNSEVTAPMPGFIRTILVQVGDVVNEDDELMIIEAMKMENPILAPKSGVVKEIRVKEKDQVDTSTVLALIE
ncbi:MAG: acetyl-CoA carboxylase biotin carboxyl carrier protein subunit [Calditrichaeota bacterium]|nr:acetyl-CoA carboxylase biotin carboxyl carrier protein subunit [Calditrichota bacterium]